MLFLARTMRSRQIDAGRTKCGSRDANPIST
jgi:hypothetical protein